MATKTNPCFPGANRHRGDVARVFIGDVVGDYLVCGEEWVRDGTFGAGHSRFYLIKRNPILGRNNEGWVKERIIQDFIAESNGLTT